MKKNFALIIILLFLSTQIACGTCKITGGACSISDLIDNTKNSETILKTNPIKQTEKYGHQKKIQYQKKIKKDSSKKIQFNIFKNYP